MSIECPRCLLTNPDSSLLCECGYDLTTIIQKYKPAEQSSRRRERRVADSGMTKEWFVVGVFAVWILLVTGEWVRIRHQLTLRKPFSLLQDSFLLSLTDLAGALLIGALGWVTVWIILAYEGRRLSPCPKRTTLGVTVVAAGLLFMSRLIAPDVLMQHITHAVIVLSIAVFAYYAGCRAWLGKW